MSAGMNNEPCVNVALTIEQAKKSVSFDRLGDYDRFVQYLDALRPGETLTLVPHSITGFVRFDKLAPSTEKKT